MAGTLVVDSITPQGGTSVSTQTIERGVAKAWVNFNGTGTSSSIRKSHNVSSVTDNGTGDFTINFTTNLPDVNYVVTGAVRYLDDNSNFGAGIFAEIARNTGALSTSAVRIKTGAYNGALYDNIVVGVAIFN